MVKSLTRDVVLAGFAAFVGAISAYFNAPGDVTWPAIKAVLIAAAYAGLRAAAGAAILKFNTWRSE